MAVNVNNFNSGKKKRKPFQCSYTKGDGECLKICSY